MATCAQCGVALAREHGQCLSCGAGPSDTMIGRSLRGKFVGGLQVRAKLGEGTTGAVYLADQPAAKRKVVVRIVHPWLSRDPGFAAAFTARARAAARLRSPHIVLLHHHGALDDGTLFIATEHLEGTTLAEQLRTHGALDPERAVALATQVCDALTEAHRRHVVHRDLKPANLMLLDRGDGPGFVKVLDFSSAACGTPPYASPELTAEAAVDVRSDLYSLACILYEMLAGRPPFVARTPQACAALHKSEPAPPLIETAPAHRVHPALEACLMRALAKDPHHRPQSAEAFADELWLAVITDEDRARATAAGRIETALRPSFRAVGGALAAVGVVVAGGLAWASTADDAPGPSPPTVAAVAAPHPHPARDVGADALARLSRGRLESELQRVAVLRGITSEQADAALRRYEQAASTAPRGLDADHDARSLLAEVIVGWQARPPARDGAGRSLDELAALFLRMDSPLPLQERRHMLNALQGSPAGEPMTPTAARASLVGWIAAHGHPAAPIGGSRPRARIRGDSE